MENKTEFTKWLNENYQIEHGMDISGPFIVAEGKKIYFNSPTLEQWMGAKENEFNSLKLNS